MGQKVHPYGFRLGVVKTWKSKWYEDKNYAKWLHEDLKLKAAIRKKFAHAGIAEIEMERAANKAKVVIYTSRPGIIIGKRGAGVEQLPAGELCLVFGFLGLPLGGREDVPVDRVMPAAVHLVERFQPHAAAGFLAGDETWHRE